MLDPLPASFCPHPPSHILSPNFMKARLILAISYTHKLNLFINYIVGGGGESLYIAIKRCSIFVYEHLTIKSPVAA